MSRPDKSLLGLEGQLETTSHGDTYLPSLRLPSVARSPKETNEKELMELAETLLSGTADTKKLDELSAKAKGYISVIPEAGLCIKMKQKNGKKAFLNICKAEQVPALQEDVNDETLLKALQESSVAFRIPMSIGDAHDELDNSGSPCPAFDIAVNPSFFVKLDQSELFYNFFISLAMEALEEKYKLELDRNSIVRLRGKKSFGTIKEQRVRTKPTLISEVDNSMGLIPARTAETVSSSAIYDVPVCELWVDPDTTRHRCLIAEITLPNVGSLNQLDLYMGNDRLVLSSSRVSPKNYRLDIRLPLPLVSAEADAAFSRLKKILTLTVPVKHAGQERN